MNRFLSGSSLIRMLVLVSGILFLFSCMEEDDMRLKTVAELGEPDEIMSGGYGPDVYELYFYDRADINRVYQYRKSASGCGSQGNWYVANVYLSDLHFQRELYEPPKIEHTPLKTAATGTLIQITARITDDNYVKDAIMYYRIPTEEDFLPLTMSLEDSSRFSAEITPDRVTSAGIEYYIEATDSRDHKTRLPERSGTYVITVSEGAAKTVGNLESTTVPKLPKFAPTPLEKRDQPL